MTQRLSFSHGCLHAPALWGQLSSWKKSPALSTHLCLIKSLPSTHLNPRNTLSPVVIMSSVVYSSKLPALFKAKALPLPQLQAASVGRAVPQLAVIHTHLSWVLQRPPAHLTTATWALLPAFSGGWVITPPSASGQLDTSSILSETC